MPILPQTLNLLSDSSLLDDDAPLIVPDITDFRAMLVDWYEPKDPAPATAPVSGPQVLPEVRKPVDPEHTASRERRLAPAPLRPETKATDPEMTTKPVARGRKDLPRKGVVGKIIQKKVDHACVRCR